MQPPVDPYAALGLSRSASADDIRLAYATAARRFRPDSNSHPFAADEFRRVNEAVNLIGEPDRRAAFDAAEATTDRPKQLMRLKLTPSRASLPIMQESQVVYALLEITADPRVTGDLPTPPVNLCLVIDRSTSMQGERLEQVKRAVLPLIDQLGERDIFSVVAFSDRAEVIIPAQRNPEKAHTKARVSTLYAAGGTEILQGLVGGLTELHRYLNPSAVNHLILLTDGRTYGDEADCLSLASLAALDGVNIHGLGIGDEWNDTFLDDMAGRTGGSTVYINSPSAVSKFFRDKMHGLSSTFAERVRLIALNDAGVSVQLGFRSAPEPAPVHVGLEPVRLGSLRRGGKVEVLLQFVVPPRPAGLQWLSRLIVLADVLGLDRMDERLMGDISLEVRADAPAETPPVAIVEALSKLTLYRLQEKAAAEAAAGQTQQATQRLERLASRLLASGEKSLAKTAMVEARRLSRTHKISPEGQKALKFGTRALFSPKEED
jgi:Ca-activated chloride channel family protein